MVFAISDQELFVSPSRPTISLCSGLRGVAGLERNVKSPAWVLAAINHPTMNSVK
jgi:hypothetical protein